MPITRFSHALPPKSHLQQEEDASTQEVSSQRRAHPAHKPSEEDSVFLYVQTSPPAFQRKAALNQGLNRLEATQTGKQYSESDTFLSEQVGNPKKAKENAEKQSFAVAFIDGTLIAGLGTLVQNAFQTLTNKQGSRRLSAEAHSHTALAPLAHASEKNELLGQISTALSDKTISSEAKAILTRIQAQSNPSVSDLHHALAAFKHLQAREALEGRIFSKWFPLLLGLGSAVGVVYSTYRHSPEAEKRQVEINRRNRAILNQAGRDITVGQAKEHFPQYFSPLGNAAIR
jgi:hypothetical protein